MNNKTEIGLSVYLVKVDNFFLKKSQTTPAFMVKPLDPACIPTITFVQQFKLSANVNKISNIKKKSRERMSHPPGAVHIIDESLSLILSCQCSSVPRFCEILTLCTNKPFEFWITLVISLQNTGWCLVFIFIFSQNNLIC